MDEPRPSGHPPQEGGQLHRFKKTFEAVRAASLKGEPAQFPQPQDRILGRVSDLLKAEGLPNAEVVPPTDQQLMGMVDSLVGRLAEQQRTSIRGRDFVEPDIVSVSTAVSSPKNSGLLDYDSPYGAAISGKTFRGGNEDVTTVTIRYSTDENDDRIFTDQYGLDESGAPFTIDAGRYEGRRSFPEVAEILTHISEGDTDSALQGLANTREGRRNKIFMSLEDMVYYAPSSGETIQSVYRFLIDGIRQKQCAPAELTKVLAWSPGNLNRTPDDARYVAFRNWPNYETAMNIIRTQAIPQDESGSNVTTDGINSLPYVLKGDGLPDEDFRKLMDVLPIWTAQFEQPSHSDELYILVPTLITAFPHIARTESQIQMARQALETAKGNRRTSREAEHSLTYLESQRLLKSVDTPTNADPQSTT